MEFYAMKCLRLFFSSAAYDCVVGLESGRAGEIAGLLNASALGSRFPLGAIHFPSAGGSLINFTGGFTDGVYVVIDRLSRED